MAELILSFFNSVGAALTFLTCGQIFSFHRLIMRLDQTLCIYLNHSLSEFYIIQIIQIRKIVCLMILTEVVNPAVQF